jgi:hypothetical protein
VNHGTLGSNEAVYTSVWSLLDANQGENTKLNAGADVQTKPSTPTIHKQAGTGSTVSNYISQTRAQSFQRWSVQRVL